MQPKGCMLWRLAGLLSGCMWGDAPSERGFAWAEEIRHDPLTIGRLIGAAPREGEERLLTTLKAKHAD